MGDRFLISLKRSHKHKEERKMDTLTEQEKGIVAMREVAAMREKMAACGGQFEYRVRELHGLGASLSKAIRYIATNYPQLHDDYLKRAKRGEAGTLHGGIANV
jgi:hypothetical protein